LLQEMKRSERSSIVLILFVPEGVPPPLPNVRDVLVATLPALLDPCREMLVAIEGVGIDREFIRAFFRVKGLKNVPRLYTSLDEAIAHARSLLPQEVLELQRLAFYSGSSPGGGC
jgi:hypothetical protein